MRTDRQEVLGALLWTGVSLAAATLVSVLVVRQMLSSAENHGRRTKARMVEMQFDEVRRGQSSTVILYDIRGTDSWLEQAASLVSLESLALDQTDVSDAGIKQVSTLPRLKSLRVQGGQITDKAVEYLAAAVALESLELCNTTVTDHGIRSLARLPRLRVLTIEYHRPRDERPALSDQAVLFIESLKLLDRIELRGDWFSAAAISRLQSSLPRTAIVVK
jgi:hypothetical protein